MRKKPSSDNVNWGRIGWGVLVGAFLIVFLFAFWYFAFILPIELDRRVEENRMENLKTRLILEGVFSEEFFDDL